MPLPVSIRSQVSRVSFCRVCTMRFPIVWSKMLLLSIDYCWKNGYCLAAGARSLEGGGSSLPYLALLRISIPDIEKDSDSRREITLRCNQGG